MMQSVLFEEGRDEVRASNNFHAREELLLDDDLKLNLQRIVEERIDIETPGDEQIIVFVDRLERGQAKGG